MNYEIQLFFFFKKKLYLNRDMIAHTHLQWKKAWAWIQRDNLFLSYQRL